MHLRINIFIYTHKDLFVYISFIDILIDVLQTEQWRVFLDAPLTLAEELEHKRYLIFIEVLILI